MERVVDVVKFIGKRGLSCKCSNDEAAYTFDDEEIDRGTFFEVVKLFRKNVSCTPDHLSHVVQINKKQHEKGNGS